MPKCRGDACHRPGRAPNDVVIPAGGIWKGGSYVFCRISQGSGSARRPGDAFVHRLHGAGNDEPLRDPLCEGGIARGRCALQRGDAAQIRGQCRPEYAQPPAQRHLPVAAADEPAGGRRAGALLDGRAAGVHPIVHDARRGQNQAAYRGDEDARRHRDVESVHQGGTASVQCSGVFPRRCRLCRGYHLPGRQHAGALGHPLEHLPVAISTAGKAYRCAAAAMHLF